MAQQRDNELLSDAEVRAMFESWDSNKDGVLSLEEVLAGLKQLRLPCSPSDVAYYSERFKALDRDHSGQLSRAELGLADFFTLVREKETGLRAVFDSLDADRSGFLDMDELRRALQSLNVPYDERAVGRLCVSKSEMENCLTRPQTDIAAWTRTETGRFPLPSFARCCCWCPTTR